MPVSLGDLFNPLAPVVPEDLGEGILRYRSTHCPAVHALCFDDASYRFDARLLINVGTRSIKVLDPLLCLCGFIELGGALRSLKWVGNILTTIKGLEFFLNPHWRSDEDQLQQFLKTICSFGMLVAGIVALDRNLFGSVLRRSFGLGNGSVYFVRYANNILAAFGHSYNVWQKHRLVQQYRRAGLQEENIHKVEHEVVSNMVNAWKFWGALAEQLLVDTSASYFNLPTLWMTLIGLRFANLLKSVREVEKRYIKSDLLVDLYDGAARGFAPVVH